MSSKNIEILEFNQYHKYDKAPAIIYLVLECLMKKIGGCKKNPTKSYTLKVGEHLPYGHSMSTTRYNRYRYLMKQKLRCKGLMKKFCESLREHEVKIINFRKNNIMQLTEKELESCTSQENCYISKEEFKEEDADDEKYRRVKEIQRNCTWHI